MSLLDPRLQAFLSIVQTGTVHGAAKALNLTQTGVTQRIRALESQLVTTLFTRSRSGMKLTSEGEALYRYCNGANELEGQALAGIVGSSKDTHVSMTIAGPTSIMSSRIIPNCFHLYQEFPNLLLHYRLDDQENRVELLKKGIVQFAVISPEQVTLEMDSKILKPDNYLLVASARWKNRKLSDIIKNERIVDFYENDDTTQRYLRSFGLLKDSRKDRLFANTNFALLNLIKSDIAYGTLTQEIAKEGLVSGELIALNQKKVLEDPQALAWYPRTEMPLYFKSIVNAIR